MSTSPNPYYGAERSSNVIVYGQPVNIGQPPQGNFQVPPPSAPQPPIIEINQQPVFFRPTTYANCMVCKKSTGTQVIPRNNGPLVWIMCIVFFVFTGCLCFIPFLIEQWKDKEHRCTVCYNVKAIEKARLF